MTFGGDRAFYERVFTMPTQAMQGAIVMMRVGPGPAFITGGVPAPRPAAGQRPTVGHLCVTMRDFDPNKVTGILMDNGLEPIEYGGQANTVKAMICSEGLPAVRLHTQGGDFLPETHFLKRGDPNQKVAVATPTDQKELKDPGFLVSRLAELAPQLSEQQKHAIIEKLRQVGLAPSAVVGWPEKEAAALRAKLQAQPKDSLEPWHVL